MAVPRVRVLGCWLLHSRATTGEPSPSTYDWPALDGVGAHLAQLCRAIRRRNFAGWCGLFSLVGKPPLLGVATYPALGAVPTVKALTHGLSFRIMVVPFNDSQARRPRGGMQTWEAKP